MSQLEDMRILIDAVDLQSFTAAAERQGLSKQYVSKRISALEARLGARLLNRTTRRLHPTELGLAYYERAVRIVQEVEDAEQMIASEIAMPRGRLRLSAPMSFGTMHLSPLLPEFLARHGEVQLELDLSDRVVDLVAEGYDMGLRIGALQDSSLIAQLIASVEVSTCCSPSYLAEHGAPDSPDELGRHACLLYGHARNVDWIFSRDGKPRPHPVRGRFRVNNGELARDAAVAGLGITQLPAFITGADLDAGKLVRILDDWRPPPISIHAVYPHHRQSSLLIRTFSAFLRERFDSRREHASTRSGG